MSKSLVMDNCSFENCRLISKFLWNEVDFAKFRLYLEDTIGHSLTEGYVREKWEIYQRCPMQFVANHEEEFFEMVVSDMEAINYRG